MDMSTHPSLTLAGPVQTYSAPIKRIHDGPDVQFFLQSTAYRDITSFILKVNRALVPRKRSADGTIKEFRLDQFRPEDLTPQINQIRQVISKLEALIAEAPPDTGPRRFGNVSFRKWYQLVDDQVEELLASALPPNLQDAIIELKAYLLGSFGSAQRLDYGTGHELSFIAFLVCLWKIGYFSDPGGASPSGRDSPHMIERQIVLCVFGSYLNLVHNLIITYNLEPAGSHGVWGLDDNSFLPYLFGSAQLSQPIPAEETTPPTPTPTSGSLPSAPDPSIVTRSNLVDKEASRNLYFAAIKFIYTVKRGPFWEHSPMLFDISGVKDGWGKINKGLVKMYDAEVLSKFPVVQHFPFGSLLPWERDPDAQLPAPTTHQTSQPLRDLMAGGSSTNATAVRPPPSSGIAAPWTASSGTRAPLPPSGFVNGRTQAPWAKAAGTSLPPRAQGAGRQPLHSQASRPSDSTTYGNQPLNHPSARPVSAATKNESKLAQNTAETIEEDQNETESIG